MSPVIPPTRASGPRFRGLAEGIVASWHGRCSRLEAFSVDTQQPEVMPMDSIWSGTLSFGLVAFPVSLYSAVDEREHVSFRQLHKKDMAPIRYRKFCSAEDVEVTQDEIVKGNEVSKGKYALREQE